MITSRRPVTSLLATLVLMMAIALPANAGRSVGPGSNGYERINKGVVDLGFFDSLLLLRYEDNPGNDSSTFYFSLIGGFSPRYFIAHNLALGLNLNLYLGRQWTEINGNKSDGKDYGFLGHVTVNYYVRLGNSFFFKPGIGGGGLVGKHTIPTDSAGLVLQANTYGGSIRIDLGFVYYAAKNFNLRAGPDLLIRFGSHKIPDGDSISFSSFDAGLSVGFGYSF